MVIPPVLVVVLPLALLVVALLALALLMVQARIQQPSRSLGVTRKTKRCLRTFSPGRRITQTRSHHRRMISILI